MSREHVVRTDSFTAEDLKRDLMTGINLDFKSGQQSFTDMCNKSVSLIDNLEPSIVAGHL